MAGILLLTFVCFASGIDNQPVAEEYSNRWDDLRVNGAGQFRPAFALISVGVAALIDTPYESPALHRVLLLVIHMVTIALVFLVARRLTSSTLIAAITAFVFALYPRHHEPVLWPAASMHTVMALFGLFSFLCYLKARESQSRYWLAASVVAFGIGIMNSEAGVVIVGLILAYEVLWHPPDMKTPRLQYAVHLLRRAAPYVVITACYVGVLLVLRGGPSEVATTDTPMSGYHLVLSISSIKDLGGYLTYSLFMYVPLRSIDSEVLKMALLAVTLVIFGAAFLLGSRIVRFGVCWVALTVVPYALFVPFGNADRYFYLASVGIALAIAGVAAGLIRVALAARPAYRSGVAVLAALFLALYAATSMVWIDERSREWETAGITTANVLDQVHALQPQVEAGSTFYFVDLPTHHGQVSLLHWGIHRMLHELYQDDSLHVFYTVDPGISSAVQNAPSSDEPTNNTYVYQYRDGEIADVSTRFADPSVQSLLLQLEPPP